MGGGNETTNPVVIGDRKAHYYRSSSRIVSWSKDEGFCF